MPDDIPDDEKPTNPEIEVTADESWKDQVRKENEQLEAEYAQRASQVGANADSDASHGHERREFGPSPPPTFDSLVSIFSTQAMVGLGAFADPNDESSGPQLEIARHFIDLLGVLEEKTAGNLSSNESRLLTATLHELRMAFLEVSRQQPSGKAPSS